MKTSTPDLIEVLTTGSFTRWYEAELWYDNVRRLASLPVSDVRISEDDSRAIKASGSLKLSWTDDRGASILPLSAGDLFAPFGSEIALYARISAGTFQERIPMGWFQVVDVPTMRDSTMFFASGFKPGPLEYTNLVADPDTTATTLWARPGAVTTSIVNGRLRMTTDGSSTPYVYPSTTASVNPIAGRFPITAGTAFGFRTQVTNNSAATVWVTLGAAFYTSTGSSSGAATQMLPRVQLNPGDSTELELTGAATDGASTTTGMLPLLYMYGSAGGGLAPAGMNVDSTDWALFIGNVPISPLPHFSGNSMNSSKHVYTFAAARNASASLRSLRGDPIGNIITTGTELDLTLQDRFIQIQRDTFDVPSAPSQLTSVWNEIGILTGMQMRRTMPDAPITRSVVYQEDRMQAVLDLADLLGGVPYSAPDGTLSMRPKAWGAVVDTLRRGDEGTIVELGRGMSADQVYNKVVFRGQGDKQDQVLASSEIYSGPLRTKNADGSRSPAHRRPTFRSNQFVNTNDQAKAYTDSELARVSTLNAIQWPITEIWNPLRELGDVVNVVDEQGRTVLCRIVAIERDEGATQKVTVVRG